jgi:Arc/MetJ family transcription regulator
MKTREEISVNDLQAVMAAAALLRQYGLISVAKIREVRQAVHEDCNVHMERYSGCDDVQRLVNDAWRQTRPL